MSAFGIVNLFKLLRAMLQNQLILNTANWQQTVGHDDIATVNELNQDTGKKVGTPGLQKII